MDSFKPLLKYFSFQGRASKAEFIKCFQLLLLAAFMGGLVEGFLDTGILKPIFVLIIAWPVTALVVRRLHDTGRSGWAFFIGFVPVIGQIFLYKTLLEEKSEIQSQYDLAQYEHERSESLSKSISIQNITPKSNSAKLIKPFIILLFILVGAFVADIINPYSLGSSSEASELAERAIQEGDGSLCEKIKSEFMNITHTEESLKFICFTAVAVGLKDASLCKDNTSLKHKDLCFSIVGEKLQSQSICEEIFTEWMKEGCFRDVAVSLQDSASCDKILKQETKQRCLKEVDRSKTNPY